jgi:hypothetical protein
MKALITQMMDEQDLSEVDRKALNADAESRKMLFWNGYERMWSNPGNMVCY